MNDLQRLHLRAAFFSCLRAFFADRSFLEVQTPVRQPVLIPEAEIEPFTAGGWLLQASPELCMKRLLALGADRIYQLCPCFRRNERGRLHSEEFLMLEWYRRGADYRDLMADCEQLVAAVAAGVQEREPQPFAGVDLTPPWLRLTVAEAFSRFSPLSLTKSLESGEFDRLLVEHVEPQLGHTAPLFLCDYPLELASLARRSRHNPAVAERFELYIRGVEVANGFSELTDAREQRRRFLDEISRAQAQRGRQYLLPERFLAELAAIGDAAGIALGAERLLMLAINEERLEAVQSFPATEL